jgi:hypothetical protein
MSTRSMKKNRVLKGQLETVVNLRSSHAVESERARQLLANDAITGLREALLGRFVSDKELDQALGVAPRSRK